MDHSELTPSQKQVVEFPYEPETTIKVVAGPGSGKTVTLLHKVHYLVSNGIVSPEEILVLSLTNKAVDNAAEKLQKVFSSYNDDTVSTVPAVNIYTIHGLANRIVVEKEGLINIIEDNGWRGLMKLVSADFWKAQPSKMRTVRSFAKIFRDFQLGKTKSNFYVDKISALMRNSKVLTNDDLIVRAGQYLRQQGNGVVSDDNVVSFLQNKIKIVFIDEFQDLYPSLLPLLEQLSKGKQLVLFGDINQSIYSFLGDNKIVRNSLDKLHEVQKTHTLYLRDNFRNTPEIIDSALHILGETRPLLKDSSLQEIIKKPPSGIDPLIYHFHKPVDELGFFVREIRTLLENSAKLSDIAILTKTNAHLENIANHLSSYGIPFKKLRAQPDWLSDSRIQYLIDLLRMIVLTSNECVYNENPTIHLWQSDFSVIVSLSGLYGISSKSLQRLYSASQNANMSLWGYISGIPTSEWSKGITNKLKIQRFVELLKPLIETGSILNYKDPLLLLQKICEVAYQLDYQPLRLIDSSEVVKFKTYIEELLLVMKISSLAKPVEVSLAEWFIENYLDESMNRHYLEFDSKDSDDLSAIKLSTIHSSKGLEFPIVFLSGSSYPAFPIEDNALYVGMTRARNLLYLSNVMHRTISTKGSSKDNSLKNNTLFWKYYNRDLARKEVNTNADVLRYYASEIYTTTAPRRGNVLSFVRNFSRYAIK